MKIKKHFKVNLILFFISLVFIFCFINHKVFLKALHPIKYQEQVYKYSKEFGLEPMLVFAMIRIESNFDRYALSEKGAKGLMQITDKTGLWGGEVLKINDFSTTYLFKPDINIRIGCWYMSNLIKEFHGDTALAIIAYNGGSGRVREWLKDRELSKTGKELEKIPYEETDKYVKKVIQEYELLRYLYQ